MRRIGVALGNTLSASARPLTLIDSVPTDQRFARIAELIRTWQPDRLVVGRPLDEDGSLTETTRLAERFANQLRGRFGLAVEAVDERFSSREAQAIIAATGRRGASGVQNTGHDDPMAAAVISETTATGPTASTRLLPKSAYKSRGATLAYKPACGGSPANNA